MREVELIKKGFGLILYKSFLRFKWNYFLNRNGNRFSCSGRLINCTIDVKGTGNLIEIGRDVKLNNVRISITGDGHTLKIGNGTVWNEWGWIRIEDENNSVIIGDNGDFRGCFFTCSDKNTAINIGEDCLFSADVVLRTSDSHSVLDEAGERINPGRSVEIGRHVWIGNGANVLKGSKVGDNSIVGTMSVVSGKTIPQGSIVAGNPAKILRGGVNWCKSRI